MELIKTYVKPYGNIGKWDFTKEKAHKKLIKEGWESKTVEMTRAHNLGKSIFLGLLFLPLAFIKADAVKVSYFKEG